MTTDETPGPESRAYLTRGESRTLERWLSYPSGMLTLGTMTFGAEGDGNGVSVTIVPSTAPGEDASKVRLAVREILGSIPEGFDEPWLYAKLCTKHNFAISRDMLHQFLAEDARAGLVKLSEHGTWVSLAREQDEPRAAR